MSKILVGFLMLTFGCRSESQENTSEYDSSKIGEAPTSIESGTSRTPFMIDVLSGSNWSVVVDTILADEFDFSKKWEYKESTIDGDSLLNAMVQKFPGAVKLTDSCCILKGIDRSISLCKKRPQDDKGWQDYKGYGYLNGYLIVVDAYYESGYYLLFDPITGKYAFMMHEPIFISKEIVYGAGSYYGEGQFQIANLVNDKYFGFESTWDLRAFYEEANSVFLQFQYGKDFKFLRIKY